MNESDIIITMLPDGKVVGKVWSEIIKFSKTKNILLIVQLLM